MTLPTLDQLEAFWGQNRARLPYAACATGTIESPDYLRHYEWVFGPTKVAVVKTVFRWKKVGIRCEWYDWAKDQPEMYLAFLADAAGHREARREEGDWTPEEEARYQEILGGSESGWWRLSNLPQDLSHDDWFSVNHDSLTDRTLRVEEAERILQEQTFDEWRAMDVMPINFYDPPSLDEAIAYWRRERRAGQGYYGDENEVRRRRGRRSP